MVFVNPADNQDEIYVNPQLSSEIGNTSELYSELKYTSENALNCVDNGDISDYIPGLSPRDIDEEVGIAEDIDSFTAPEILSDIISGSEIASIKADVEEGVYDIRTYKTIEDGEGWTFWTGYLDESEGEIVGQVNPPYVDENHSFSHSVQDPHTDLWMDDDIRDAAYVLARETIPEVPDYSLENSNEDTLKGQFKILEGDLGLISQLEEVGKVKIDNHAQAGSRGPRGGELGNSINSFVNLANRAGVVDYTVSNENKENVVKLESGGYKFLTRNISDLGFSNPDELIESRTIPAWKK